MENNHSVRLTQQSGKYYVEENGFKFEMPNTLGTQLENFLSSQEDQNNVSVGEWVLSLPFNERMRVRIQMIKR